MRSSILKNSTIRLLADCRKASGLLAFGLTVIYGAATFADDDPAPMQLDFMGQTELPMEIIKGSKPATADNIVPADRDTEEAVQIPEETKGEPLEILTGSRNAASETASEESFDSGTLQEEEVEQPAKENARLSDRTVAQIDRLTGRLVNQSRDAWLRGLMDQSSYAAWLDMASTTQLRIAKQQGDDLRILQILKDQVALWAEAAAELEEFDQPAARGWQADLAHSQVMLLRAKLQYSTATGQPLHQADELAYRQLAARHLDARLQDFQTGTGTAASVLAAARMVDEQLVMPESAGDSASADRSVAVARFQVDRPVALRSALNEILRPVHLETFPQAISLRDLAEDRAAIRLAATFTDYVATLEAARNAERYLSQLDQQSAAVAARQFARFQTGTATPSGMLREWWLQETIAGTLAEELRDDSSFYTAQTQRLEGIHQIAMSIDDLRGRNSADVAAAEMLLAVRQLDLEPLSGRRKTAPYDEFSGQTEALVIEYGKSGEADDTAAEPAVSDQP